MREPWPHVPNQGRFSNAAIPQLAPVRKAAWAARVVVRQHCSTVHPPCATVFGVGEYQRRARIVHASPRAVLPSCVMPRIVGIAF